LSCRRDSAMCLSTSRRCATTETDGGRGIGMLSVSQHACAAAALPSVEPCCDTHAPRSLPEEATAREKLRALGSSGAPAVGAPAAAASAAPTQDAGLGACLPRALVRPCLNAVPVLELAGRQRLSVWMSGCLAGVCANNLAALQPWPPHVCDKTSSLQERARQQRRPRAPVPRAVAHAHGPGALATRVAGALLPLGSLLPTIHPRSWPCTLPMPLLGHE